MRKRIDYKKINTYNSEITERVKITGSINKDQIEVILNINSNNGINSAHVSIGHSHSLLNKPYYRLHF